MPITAKSSPLVARIRSKGLAPARGGLSNRQKIASGLRKISPGPTKPRVAPRAGLEPKLVPLASHARTAEQLASTAFSGMTRSGEPKQQAPPAGTRQAYCSASRRKIVGALARAASAETAQQTLSV